MFSPTADDVLLPADGNLAESEDDEARAIRAAEEKHSSSTQATTTTTKLLRRFQGLEAARQVQEEQQESLEHHQEISHELLTIIGDYGEEVTKRCVAHERQKLATIVIGGAKFALQLASGKLILTALITAVDTIERATHLDRLQHIEETQGQASDAVIEQGLRLGLMTVSEEEVGEKEEKTFEEFTDEPRVPEAVNLTTHSDLLWYLQEIGISTRTMALGFGTTEQAVHDFLNQDKLKMLAPATITPPTINSLTEASLHENIHSARRNTHLNQKIYEFLANQIKDYIQEIKKYVQVQKKDLTTQAIDTLAEEIHRQIKMGLLQLTTGDTLALLSRLKTVHQLKEDIQTLMDETYTDQTAVAYAELASQRSSSTHSTFVTSVASAFAKLDVHQYLELVQFLLDLGMNDRQIAKIFAEKEPVKITQLIDDETSQLIRPEQQVPKTIPQKEIDKLRKALSQERQDKLYLLKKKLRAFVNFNEQNQQLFAHVKPLLHKRENVERIFHLLLDPLTIEGKKWESSSELSQRRTHVLSTRRKAIMQYAACGDAELAKDCIIRNFDHSALVDEVSNQFWAWITLAASYLHPLEGKAVELFEFLLDTATDKELKFALYRALWNQNIGTARLLIEKLQSSILPPRSIWKDDDYYFSYGDGNRDPEIFNTLMWALFSLPSPTYVKKLDLYELDLDLDKNRDRLQLLSCVLLHSFISAKPPLAICLPSKTLSVLGLWRNAPQEELEINTQDTIALIHHRLLPNAKASWNNTLREYSIFDADSMRSLGQLFTRYPTTGLIFCSYKFANSYKFGNEVMQSFIHYVLFLTYLRDLSFENPLDDKELKILFKALPQTKLTSLSLWISSDGIEALAQVIPQTNLRDVGFYVTEQPKIRTKSIKALAQVIPQTKLHTVKFFNPRSYKEHKIKIIEDALFIRSRLENNRKISPASTRRN